MMFQQFILDIFDTEKNCCDVVSSCMSSMNRSKSKRKSVSLGYQAWPSLVCMPKTLAIDGEVMFVGSFNFDQRSLNINNEIGILFHHPGIVSESSRHFHDNIEKVAFRVELVKDEKGLETMRWTGTEDGKEVVFYSEPYASFWKRFKVNLMRILPIDSML